MRPSILAALMSSLAQLGNKAQVTAYKAELAHILAHVLQTLFGYLKPSAG